MAGCLSCRLNVNEYICEGEELRRTNVPISRVEVLFSYIYSEWSLSFRKVQSFFSFSFFFFCWKYWKSAQNILHSLTIHKTRRRSFSQLSLLSEEKGSRTRRKLPNLKLECTKRTGLGRERVWHLSTIFIKHILASVFSLSPHLSYASFWVTFSSVSN